jgi:DmsE family decaheme c-type cytochrome
MSGSHRRFRSSLFWLLLTAAVLLGSSHLVFARKQPVARGATPGAGKPAAAAQAGEYVGQDACAPCHADLARNFAANPHWRTSLDTRRGPEWQGCEACHGPGKAHSESGDPSLMFSYKDLSSKAVSDQCLKCHEYGEEHANFARSAHNLNEVGCLDCHSVHFAKERQALLTDRQPLLCYSCHLEVKVEFSKPFRHRVNENLVKCTDCHSAHGGFLTRQLRSTAAQDQMCFKCHVEKAGPFVFEHAPVKTEGCVACHIPHGSSNPRLLKRSQINLLCLECHTLTVDSPVPGIPSFHNQAAKYQACTVCHLTIHGSNFSAVFFK